MLPLAVHLPVECLLSNATLVSFFLFPPLTSLNVTCPTQRVSSKHCHSQLVHSAAMLMVREHTEARVETVCAWPGV